VKARVGDWFTFRVADGRFGAARIGAVARRGRSYTGWFFGPFDAPPAASELLALTREDAVWPAHFYDLEGGSGVWERVIEGGTDAEVLHVRPVLRRRRGCRDGGPASARARIARRRRPERD
jgi:hypothetical protein